VGNEFRGRVSGVARFGVFVRLDETGADGLMLEVHPDPARAWSDGAQSLTFQRFARLMEELRLIAQAVGREI
jgi:3-deoxy-D-arabino-heptulosonate 7-phosphate (DAHP) synthase